MAVYCYASHHYDGFDFSTVNVDLSQNMPGSSYNACIKELPLCPAHFTTKIFWEWVCMAK